MSSNSFGKLLTVTTFGESHGPAIGCVVDGCPPGLEIAPEEFRHDLERRATGKSRHTSARREADEVEILSGVYEGRTTGTPIALLIRNTDQRSKDYADIARQFQIMAEFLRRDLQPGRAAIDDTADRRSVRFAERGDREEISETVAAQAPLRGWELSVPGLQASHTGRPIVQCANAHRDGCRRNRCAKGAESERVIFAWRRAR